ncbi:hypothetical protein [Spirosoma linguale]|uniref:Uncharacterized protein n=1 Tax=Spirosoma linguale (strain ATCC 33905 / DSM 74 / LMG 10896 / Claus 1) TaxID=504472 RepID=D2QC22_SPILD|nr:hypothetical protein Slin_3761 [Spirosoma linguale DSM 74]
MNRTKLLSLLFGKSTIYGLLLFDLGWLLPLGGEAQCVVYQDANQRILTSCDFYNAAGKSGTAAYRREIYLGSPYLTYPVWQAGSLQVKEGDKALTCEVAYNIVNREIMCRFPGDSSVIVMTPERFVINDNEYIRQPNHSYITILYDGPTKLSMTQSRQMEAYTHASFTKDEEIIGLYKTTTTYYIQKGSKQIKLVNPSKKSILSLLADQKEKINSKLPTTLTPLSLVDLLTYYDSLAKNEQLMQR